MRLVLPSTCPQVAEVHTYDNIVTIAIAVLWSIREGKKKTFNWRWRTCSKEQEIYHTKKFRNQIWSDSILLRKCNEVITSYHIHCYEVCPPNDLGAVKFAGEPMSFNEIRTRVTWEFLWRSLKSTKSWLLIIDDWCWWLIIIDYWLLIIDYHCLFITDFWCWCWIIID